MDSMKNHMETVHHGMVGCSTTSSGLKARKSAENHCPQCPSVFSLKSELRAHIRDRHVAEVGDVVEENREDVIVGLDDSGFREVALQYSVEPEPNEGIYEDEEDLDEFISVEKADKLPEEEILTLN